MPNRCCAVKCRGNYDDSSKAQVVPFPVDPADRQRWIRAMPNVSGSLVGRKHLYICKSHFNCEWVRKDRHLRPIDPPSIFDQSISKTCMKQVLPKTRAAPKERALVRLGSKEKVSTPTNGFLSFEQFVSEAPDRFPRYNFKLDGDTFSMFEVDHAKRNIVQYISFVKVSTPFGFLQLKLFEHEGYEIPRSYFKHLPNNRCLDSWSQVHELLQLASSYVIPTSDCINKVIEELNRLTEDLQDSPCMQFILTQIAMLGTAPRGRRYPKNLLVFATELLCTSPAAYRLVRKSETIMMPSERLVRSLLSGSFCEENMRSLFTKLSPQQRLLNLLFDEVKLKEEVRFSGGHILGYASNNPLQLATSALVTEIVCHHGGPRMVIGVTPVQRLNSVQLESILKETIQMLQSAGGSPISLICDNCPMNQGVYAKLGGPGLAIVEGLQIYLLYDYIHIFKNLRNNWITEKTQELQFVKDGILYTAKWKDVIAAYQEDISSPLRLTKLTHTAVFPKPLQRQNVALVCAVFNDKTVAFLKSFRLKLQLQEGTVEFVSLVTEWFKMMSIKQTLQCDRQRDDLLTPWTLGCETFPKLIEFCNILQTCKWLGGGIRKRKLTKYTADAFLTTTKSTIAAATHLLTHYKFQYVLPAVFSQDPLEKFFGQARQRNAGNFYIDVVDVKAAAKVQQFHQLVQYDVIPSTSSATSTTCSYCGIPPGDSDLELTTAITLEDTQTLLENETMEKSKVVYVSGYLESKHVKQTHGSEEDGINCTFLQQLDRGGLRVPTLATVFLVHSALHMMKHLPEPQNRCRTYISALIAHIDTPLASNTNACITLTNILMKAGVLSVSDRERELGCLRRKEKLAHSCTKINL